MHVQDRIAKRTTPAYAGGARLRGAERRLSQEDEERQPASVREA